MIRHSFKRAAALTLTMYAGYAFAQATDAPAAPTSAPGHYRSVDSDGKRIDVQVPAGGNSRAAADENERVLTERLNQEALKAATPPPTQAAPH